MITIEVITISEIYVLLRYKKDILPKAETEIVDFITPLFS